MLAGHAPYRGLTYSAQFVLATPNSRLGARDALPHLVAQYALEAAIRLALAASAEREANRLGPRGTLGPPQLPSNFSSKLAPPCVTRWPSGQREARSRSWKRSSADLTLPQTGMVEKRACRACDLPFRALIWRRWWGRSSCWWRHRSDGGRRVNSCWASRRGTSRRGGGSASSTWRQAHGAAHRISDATQRALRSWRHRRARRKGVREPAHPARPVSFWRCWSWAR